MTNKTSQRTDILLQLLSDGLFHSGEEIAKSLAVSRTSIWKLIQKLQSWQIKIYSVRGRGYQIPGGLELIDQALIINGLEDKNKLIKNVIVLASVDSTADYLARSWKIAPGIGRVCIAEHQSSGRGRKGRPWISPFAANLYFSIGLQLPLGLSALGGLSLALGISLCRTLNQFAGETIKIKWPNDLLANNKKLAGILVEASGDTNDSSFLNIGVGLNWDMQLKQAEEIDQPWINLKSILRQKNISRNEILIAILNNLDSALLEYTNTGFISFSKDWETLSAMYKQKVTLQMPNQKINGIEVGIESNGALRLENEKGIQIFHSGEISLRQFQD